MTKTHNFIPGDRFVSALASTISTMGTIGKTLPDDKTMLHWDSGNSQPWSAESIEKWIKPAPIEVGSWVRVIGPTPDIVEKYAGRVAQVKKTGGLVETGRFGELKCTRWSPENLRAVEAPALSDDLKQAQRLATILAEKHFPGAFTVGDTLSKVLDQIDHMTAHMVRAGTLKQMQDANIDLTRQLQIAENARLDAIGQRDEANAAIAEAGILIRKAGAYSTGEIVAWLNKHAKPTFKRGDLVTWGAEAFEGRIIGPAPTVDAPFEVMITRVIHGSPANEYLGKVLTPTLDILRHVTPSE